VAAVRPLEEYRPVRRWCLPIPLRWRIDFHSEAFLAQSSIGDAELPSRLGHWQAPNQGADLFPAQLVAHRLDRRTDFLSQSQFFHPVSLHAWSMAGRLAIALREHPKLITPEVYAAAAFKGALRSRPMSLVDGFSFVPRVG
jgi:hypothetical protein